MKLTGLQIRNMQMLQDLEKMIKELEIKRIEHDLLNKNKYAEESDDGIFSESGTERKQNPGFHGSLPDQSVMGSMESELLCRYVGKPG